MKFKKMVHQKGSQLTLLEDRTFESDYQLVDLLAGDIATVKNISVKKIMPRLYELDFFNAHVTVFVNDIDIDDYFKPC